MTPDSTQLRQTEQARMVQDTLILQKVNQAHREAFKTRFPGQVEHILRLTAERLQHCLSAKPEDIRQPATWAVTPEDIYHMSRALAEMYQVHLSIENNNTDADY